MRDCSLKSIVGKWQPALRNCAAVEKSIQLTCFLGARRLKRGHRPEYIAAFIFDFNMLEIITY